MKKPNPILPWAVGVVALAGAFALPAPSSGQNPGDEDAIARLVAEIAAQQVKIVTNQQAIDQKIATIEENMRVARIFVSRGGGTKK
jgi:hypothetical protein